MDNSIRPEIQALIARGRVEISEIEHFNCTPTESDALIPVLTNSSLARRIDRAIGGLKLRPLPEDTPYWTVVNLASQAWKYIQRSIPNPALKASLRDAVASCPAPSLPSRHYRDALLTLSAEAVNRL